MIFIRILNEDLIRTISSIFVILTDSEQYGNSCFELSLMEENFFHSNLEG